MMWARSVVVTPQTKDLVTLIQTLPELFFFIFFFLKKILLQGFICFILLLAREVIF